jgi:DNA repair protein RadD
MDLSPFKWLDLFGAGKVLSAGGFEAWVFCVTGNNRDWLSIGQLRGENIGRLLAIGGKISCLSKADDFLRCYESSESAEKTKRWLADPVTDKQIDHLERVGCRAKNDFSLTKYRAACLLHFYWSKNFIEKMVHDYAR